MEQTQQKTVRGLLISCVFLWTVVFSTGVGHAKKPAHSADRIWVVFRTGDVRIKKGRNVQRLLPSLAKSRLRVGNEVRTKSRSQADIYLGSKVLVRMKESSVIKVAQFNVQRRSFRGEIKLLAGKVLVKVKRKLTKGSQFSLRTPVAVAGVRGTTFVAEVTANRQSTISVLEGTVYSAPIRDERLTTEALTEGWREVEAGEAIAFADGSPAGNITEIPADVLQEQKEWEAEPELSKAFDLPSGLDSKEGDQDQSSDQKSTGQMDAPSGETGTQKEMPAETEPPGDQGSAGPEIIEPAAPE
jgi:hypothetical protein